MCHREMSSFCKDCRIYYVKHPFLRDRTLFILQDGILHKRCDNQPDVIQCVEKHLLSVESDTTTLKGVKVPGCAKKGQCGLLHVSILILHMICVSIDAVSFFMWETRESCGESIVQGMARMGETVF
jgi:hypothetical protein